MGLPVRARAAPAQLSFALRIAPEDVVPALLARDGVHESRDEAWSAREVGFDLQRTPAGFTLTGDPGGPGAWRPGTAAICEAELEPVPGGTRVLVRFRLHPLTRSAYLLIGLLAAAMTLFQLFVLGTTAALLMLAPFVILAGILAADRTRLRHEQRALRDLVETTFAPLAQPQEPARHGPFRLVEPARDAG